MVALAPASCRRWRRRSRWPRGEQAVQRLCRRSELLSAICHGADGTQAGSGHQSGRGDCGSLLTALGAGARRRPSAAVGVPGSARPPALAFGTVVGAGGAGYAQMSLQQQYDVVVRAMHGRAGQPGARLLAAAGDTALCGDTGASPPYGPGPRPMDRAVALWTGPSPYGLRGRRPTDRGLALRTGLTLRALALWSGPVALWSAAISGDACPAARLSDLMGARGQRGPGAGKSSSARWRDLTASRKNPGRSPAGSSGGTINVHSRQSIMTNAAPSGVSGLLQRLDEAKSAAALASCSGLKPRLCCRFCHRSQRVEPSSRVK